MLALTYDGNAEDCSQLNQDVLQAISMDTTMSS